MRPTELSHRGPGQTTPWYREPLVWLLVLIPGSAVVMGICAITLSILSYDGLVVDDYYKRGLEINRELARDRAATRYALSATLDLDSRAGKAAAELRWDEGFRPPEAVRFSLYHATRSGLDARVDLRRSTGDTYVGKLPSLAAGDYHLQLDADDWRLIGNLTAPLTLAGPVMLKAQPAPY